VSASGPEKCPKCGGLNERRECMFHWRGRDFDGMVCVKCNALWANPEFLALFGVPVGHGRGLDQQNESDE